MMKLSVLESIIRIKRNQILSLGTVVWVIVILAFRPTFVTATEYTVLWDISHGVYGAAKEYQPSGIFQPMIQDLKSYGFTVNTTNQGFLVDEPTGYDVIVVCLGSAWFTAYNSAEVTCITNFVNSGGGLLIMGDNPICPNANIQPVASVFGVSLGLSDDIFGATSNLSSHPIFDGVNQIDMLSAGEISASAPSIEVAWEEGTGKALVSVGTYGDGRVVTIGDLSTWSYLYNSVDDRQFSINTFEYLAVPEPSILALLSFGAVMLRKKSPC
jgi:hypothetical protein